MKILLLIIFGLSAPNLVGQGLVGKAAPEFSVTSTVAETEFRKLSDFAGDVVVLRFTCT